MLPTSEFLHLGSEPIDGYCSISSRSTPRTDYVTNKAGALELLYLAHRNDFDLVRLPEFSYYLSWMRR